MHQKAKRSKPFIAPRDYCAGPSVSILSLSASPSRSVHPWNATPGLLRMKSSFPPWLWEKCNEHLDQSESWMCGLSSRDREHIIQLALKELLPYPARPDSLLPSSPSVDRLRQVLREAPSVEEYLRARGPSKYEGIREHFHGDSGDTTYYWSKSYLEKLFGALIEVIEAHGTGEHGWGAVRWEVYDKVCSSSSCAFLFETILTYKYSTRNVCRV